MTKEILENKDGLIFAASPLLAATTHAFLGRGGGVSPPPYSSLNTGLHVGDDPASVEKNRQLICKDFNVEYKNLVIVTQVHGTEVIDIKDVLPPETTEADAIITARPHVAIAVQTADCVPVLFYDPDKEIVAAAHAGWRGTLSNIAGKTVAAMTKHYNSDPARIRAAIGPAIGPCCYEVSSKLIGDFCDTLNYESHEIAGSLNKGRHLDIPNINKLQLRDAGLTEDNIDQMKICTACQSDIFFSHRLEADASKNINTGRQLSLIMKTGA